MPYAGGFFSSVLPTGGLSIQGHAGAPHVPLPLTLFFPRPRCGFRGFCATLPLRLSLQTPLPATSLGFGEFSGRGCPVFLARASSAPSCSAALLSFALLPLRSLGGARNRHIGRSGVPACQGSWDGEASFPQWLHRLHAKVPLFTCEPVTLSPPFFPLGSCGLVLSPFRSWAVHWKCHAFGIADVPKRQIGGSGLSTSNGTVFFPMDVGDSASAFVDFGVYTVIPIFRALAFIFWLTLLKAIWQVLPGRSSPLGRCFGLPFLGISTASLACVGACGRPEHVALDWQPWRHRKRRTACRTAVKRVYAMPGLCRLAFILGPWSLPVCVGCAARPAVGLGLDRCSYSTIA